MKKTSFCHHGILRLIQRGKPLIFILIRIIRIHSYIGIGCFLPFSAIPQSDIIDSLKNALNNAKHDTTRVNILLQISENIYDDNVWPEYNRQALDIAEKNIPNSKGAVLLAFKKVKAAAINNIGYIHNLQGNLDRAMEYYLQSLEIRKEINDKRGIAYSLNEIGFIYKNQGNHKKALEYYLQSLEILKEIKDKQGIATSLNNIGGIYDNQGNPDKALEYYLQSLEIRKEINDKRGIAYSLNNIGSIYNNQGNPDKGLEYFLQSLEIEKEINDKQGIAYSLNNIGFIYHNQGNPNKALEYYLQSLELRKEINDKRGIAESLNNIGAIYKNQGNHDMTLEYFLQSLEIRKEIRDKHGIANSLYNIGVIYHNQGPDMALEYYLQSLKIRKEINDKQGIANSLNNIGRVYLQRKNYAAATDYCTRSLEIAEELGYPENIMRAAGCLHKIYKAMAKRDRKRGMWEYGEHFAKAMEYNELYTQMRDTVHNNDMSKAIGKTEGKFEFKMALKKREQREKEKAMQEAKETAHRNNLQNVAIAIGLLILVSSIIFMGKFELSEWLVNAISFVPFVLLFEFITEFTEPFTEALTGNQPVYEVLINTTVVLIIFPIQYFFEKKLRQRLDKAKRKRVKRGIKKYLNR